MQLLIIGGSDAGIAAGLRARKLDPTSRVTIVVANRFPNYSICGLPSYVSGETPDWHQLAHRTAEELIGAGLELLLDHTARTIFPERHEVSLENDQGQVHTLTYDRLVVATGAEPLRSNLPGLGLPGVFPLHTMEDSFRVHDHLARGGATGRWWSAVATSAWRWPTRSRTADRIELAGDQLTVRGSNGRSVSADLVVVAPDVQPNAALAADAGVETGIDGAMRVDRSMRTNVRDAFAAGDCVETWHRLLGAPTYLPLGPTAHKQGRVAGENAVGGARAFEGSLGTQVVKVFELAIAPTGLRDDEARAAGFDPVTVETEAWDHTQYYPNPRPLLLRVTGDRRTGRLLGAQILGHWQAEVAKRTDVFAAALLHGMTVDAINDLDLSYTPPLGRPWDAVQEAAQEWARAALAVAA